MNLHTSSSPDSNLSRIPSVDRVLGFAMARALAEQHGRALVTAAARAMLAELREDARAQALTDADLGEVPLSARLERRVGLEAQPRLRPVFNLTGTVLHTNLGRALLPQEAIDAVATAMSWPSTLEFELESGKRGERDSIVEGLLCELTGAEAATAVNNNAAAVLLLLNTLAQGKEVPVSRGELIEIGGAFRIPDIMRRAGAKLVEVGTTNRTHPKDFEAAIGPRTALVMKVHCSNYAITGFTASVDERALAGIAHARSIPCAVDLGSGSLVDLTRFGLPKEPTPQETLAQGADLVTFSGDKLLGGPQAGIIVGRKDLIERIRRNPLKRALRLGKITLAALEAVLRLYRDPDRLAQRLTTFALLTRSQAEIEALARSVQPHVAQALGASATVSIEPMKSQIGSGALPSDVLPSAGLAIRTASGSGAALKRLEAAFRNLPIPVIGFVKDGALRLDLRCLTNEERFVSQLGALRPRP
jgi:L-seryl-tRNA(Ser) seleniumtransferase